MQIHFSIIVYFMFWIVKLGWGNKTGGQSYISCYSRRLTGLQTRRIWGEECTESFIEAGWCCLCLPINCHYTVQWAVGRGADTDLDWAWSAECSEYLELGALHTDIIYGVHYWGQNIYALSDNKWQILTNFRYIAFEQIDFVLLELFVSYHEYL